MKLGSALNLAIVLIFAVMVVGGCSWGEEQTATEDVVNHSLKFDGSSAYVTIPGDRRLYGSWTVEIWVKPARWQPETMSQILTIEHADTYPGGQNHFVHLRLHPAGLLQYRISAHPSKSSHRLTNQAAARNLSSGWHHLALTQREAPEDGRVNTIYIDGERVVSDTGPYPRVRNRFWMGSKNSLGDFFAGHLDELRFWDHARSPSQIRSRMNKPLSGEEDGLVGYWPLNRGEKTMVLDAVGPHDGTIYEAAWTRDVPFGASEEESRKDE